MSDMTKLGDQIATMYPKTEVYFEQEVDFESRTIRMVAKEREVSTSARAYAKERFSTCWACYKGLIPYNQVAANGRTYVRNARCFCDAGDKWGPRDGKDGRWEVASFKDIFGRWPTPPRHGAIVLTPVPPTPEPEPAQPQTVIPFEHPKQQEPDTYQRPEPTPWTGTIVEEIDP